MAYLPKKKSSKYRKVNKKKYTPTTILYDDRERNPWKLDTPEFVFEKARLAVGDYTIKGHEDKVAIEKKSGIIELISNLSGKDRPRFKKFLVRLSQYEIKCIIIEDSFSRVESVFRYHKKTHLDSKSFYYWISVITITYGIPILFIGKNKSQREIFLHYLFSDILKQL